MVGYPIICKVLYIRGGAVSRGVLIKAMVRWLAN